jgi:hypothetical protein
MTHTIDTELVPLAYELIYDFNVSPVRPGSVELSVTMIKHNCALTFKGFPLLLKMSQVYDILVASFELCDNLRSPLISSGLILHWVDDEDALWD